MRAVLLLIALCLPLSSYAANVTTGSSNGKQWVFIQGKIEVGDDEAFIRAIGQTPELFVYLQSPGGYVNTGLRIGQTIFNRKYTTVVPSNSDCASICGIMWLGGSKRYEGQSARVGFHAAFTEEDGTVRLSAPANAFMGIYLDHIGIKNRDTLTYLLETPPERMRWMTREDAVANGIEYEYAPNANVPAGVGFSYSASTADRRSALPALTEAEKDVARKLVRNFYPRYKDAGMAGIDQSIDQCYSRARELKTYNSALYCSSLDILAMIVDSNKSEADHLPPTPRNSRDAVVRRAKYAALAVDMSREDGNLDVSGLRDRAGVIALLAADNVDTTEDPNATIEKVASEAPPLQTGRSVGTPGASPSPCRSMAAHFGDINHELGRALGSFFCW